MRQSVGFGALVAGFVALFLLPVMGAFVDGIRMIP